MQVTRATLIKLSFGFTLSFLIFVLSGKILANSTELTVDVKQVLADVSNNPIGISVNYFPQDLKITEPLKNLKVGSLRFPDGELGDYYLFNKENPAKAKASLQDPNFWITRQSRRVNADGTYNTTLSFDDFMSICKSVKAEPFIIVGIDAIAYTGNAPHATPEEVLEAAVEWVRYANIVKGYGIKYWEIGNENYLNNLTQESTPWTPEKYAHTVVNFSRAMKAVDPSIKIGVNGRYRFEWWNKVMPIVKDDVDFLVAHQYSRIQDYQEWKNDPYSYAYDENIKAAYDENIKAASKAIDTYNPNLRINVTEISSLGPANNFHNGNNTWKMLHNFEVLGNALIYNQVDYLHFWTSKWMEKDSYSKAHNAFDSNYKLMPMGYPLKIWNNFLKQQMVYSTKKVGTIRSWASYDPDDNSLNVFVLNKDEVSQNVSITLDNYMGSIMNERWILKGSTPESIDVTWEKAGLVPVSGSKVTTKLDPLSVTVIALQGGYHADE